MPEDCWNTVRQINDLSLFAAEFAALIYYLPLLDILKILFSNPEFSFNLMITQPKAALIGNGISDGSFHWGTQFIRSNHKITEEETRKQISRYVDKNKFSPAEIVTAQCPASPPFSLTPKFCTPPVITAQTTPENNSDGMARRRFTTDFTCSLRFPRLETAQQTTCFYQTN